MVDVALPRPRTAREAVEFPAASLPQVPSAVAVWGRALVLGWILLALFSLDLLSALFMDFWYLQSLDFESVFRTNFRMGATLFVVVLAAFTIAAAIPAITHQLSGRAKSRMIQIGLMTGILAGYQATTGVTQFLQFSAGRPFGETDPVFGHDIGFYAFKLPAIQTVLDWASWWGVFMLVMSVAAARIAHSQDTRPRSMPKFLYIIGRISTPFTRVALFLLFSILALRTWVHRYDILLADNSASAIANGAEYLDTTGFFSTINGYTVQALAIFFASAIALRLGAFHRAAVSADSSLARQLRVSMVLVALLPGIAVDLSFKAMVAFRDQTKVTPNEPVIQLPYIKRHIDATNKGFDLDKVQPVQFEPKGPEDPEPDINRILQSPTIKNASLWPGYVSYLEEVLDLQHQNRLLLTEGDPTVYGPALDVFRQQEKLRPYYDFLDIDTTRYNIDGEKQMFASATRELPIRPDLEAPWLLWWGQRQLLFTHGYGLVASKVNEQTAGGGNVFVSRGVPTRTAFDELKVDKEAIYYGEGSGEVAFSNAGGIEEFDYPTEQGRATLDFPSDVKAGVYMDSFWKRLVFGWQSGRTFDVFFSELIRPTSRVHFYRTPLERVERLAPFVYFDTDPYAVAADGKLIWMVNGLTSTDRYPYSWINELGDKSDVRTPTPREVRMANYIRDSVKATVDAYTGKVTLYKWADEPVVNTWASVYPGLFTERSKMSPAIREQVYYPVQFFHSQFDDVYVYYHMRDPVEFFNQEDLWDDGDEVKGSLIEQGEAMNFSIEPYYWMAETGGSMPQSSEPTQFSMSMIFTPESALNLRSIATVYMDGEDYGKLSILQVPKGQFTPGPEQADAAIDQDALISSQITLWNRLGTEVVRGHTTALVIDDEVIYIEPMFIKSKQNPAPQMKRVVAVFRGQAFMGLTLEGALRAAVLGEPEAALEGPSGGGELPQDVSSVGEGETSADRPVGEIDTGGGPPPQARGGGR